ncbi:dTDP-glucose pyrophosphorylase [Ameyamaea chiangmaiensis NBRC 103196]|uniref:Capsular biosynthesis protein n=1 Tax=Ameyamaea chiangmaiensis TaxID=442969 RepID=A0A850P704_9PROT|nr:glycosyltransferase family 2 protein [Ameyamaea chiangmaiensis]MBS4074952.1 glycosyltransferase family 2 protein [Ameyamaea chiangmaiensis]NVN39718.1 capsular biosynthesis protein [Ameyamaea chiangmaiensis]GBQ63314.1 dTDP-glucose pyrophosphorylase [Ameyamaea chiangmaiensis NBRC 103196]
MIVIPMAGLSSRFTRVGYTVPKYMLPLDGQTVFDRAVGSFAQYFDREPFLFIARSVADTEAFIAERTRSLGIPDVRTVILDRETAGQAETVECGLIDARIGDDTALTIFNIDTFRPDFSYPKDDWFKTSDGYLEVFEGEGANWSYAAPIPDAQEPRVARTTEKQPISNLCSNGLYYFRRASDFRSALFDERAAMSAPELYIAPLYNHLIARGKKVHYHLVPKNAVIFCGIPAEYEALGGMPPP